ncbi:hypothetical protein BIY27_12260 [Gibbsiella quercinecans]|uniref:hypothetical protein n=1 Tax=Gibbsiella quercinecans TaxID=929813 RepID=UPI000EF27B19|nr:hypothetical protein [Gibbsiella quercinecans]RLM11849.1 hypothetical protein BIY27_12260 [Gibbsiella quercinecans]
MSELFKWVLSLVIMMAGCVLLFTPGNESVPEVLSEHWINDCRLLETNIDKGFFSPEQNRLQCGDVIENVNKDDYDMAINGNKKITISELIEEVFSK